MIDEPAEFENPAFRTAVRRAMGKEHAPSGLRGRIAMTLAADQASIAAAGSSSPAASARGVLRWRELTQPKTLAIAAVTLVAVGFAALQILNFVGWTDPYSPASFAAAGPVSFPDSFALSLVGTHDNCAKAPNHRQVAGEDPVALRDRLSQLQGIPVSAIAPADGWQFRGAGVCMVEKTRTVHLLYARGSQALSIFSLPVPESCHESAYEQVVSNHPLAGFTNHGALYCVVGSDTGGQFTVDELKPLVAKVRTSLGVAADCGPRPAPTSAAPMHASAAPLR
jgi:hypothetical protein